MAGEERYDDSAFVYFALSVLVIILIPSSLHYIKAWKNAFSSKYTGNCHCGDCIKKARKLQLASRKPSGWSILKFVLYLLVVLLFLYLLRSASQSKVTESSTFDPYQILELDHGAPEEDIKKQYRKLTLKYHPDKNKEEGAEEKFILVSKAYDTLTDPEVREKWEKYGNPDGPQGFSVGIALPSFLVDGKNKLVVLGFYILFLVVIFPIIAICYWQRQKSLAHNQLMNKTLQLFYSATNENMRFRKLINVFALAFEYCDKMPIRRSDEEVLLKLKPLVPALEDSEKKVHKSKKKELLPQIVKHVMLFFGHFSRLFDIMAPLEADVDTLVKQFHHLVIGMAELTVTAWDNKTRQPRRWLVPTVEAIKLSQMITQAVWSESSRMGLDTSLLQLPHITEKLSGKLASKKYRMYSITDFVSALPDKRRDILLQEGLTEEQIRDIENVCKTLPHDIKVSYKCEVDEDDDNVGVTGGSIVTLIATFSRPSKRDPKKAVEETKQEESSDPSKMKIVKKSGNDNDSKKKNNEFAKPADVKDEDLIEVHAPFFPEKKNELWWLIIADERTNRIQGITRIAALKDGTEAKIPFAAPPKPGIYAYTLMLLSDSYVGFDQTIPIKLQVEKEVPIKEQKEEYSGEDEEDQEPKEDEDAPKDEPEDEEDSVGSEDEK